MPFVLCCSYEILFEKAIITIASFSLEEFIDEAY